MSQTPKHVAQRILDGDIKLDEYHRVQEARRRRLKFWKEKDVPTMIKAEIRLIIYGEKVLKAYDILTKKLTH